MTYYVELWGSKPETNDDCHTDMTFETREESLACFNDPWNARFGNGKDFRQYYEKSTAFFRVIGPDIDLVRPNPGYKKTPDIDSEWKLEMAREAGMLHGVDGYNEIMGC